MRVASAWNRSRSLSRMTAAAFRRKFSVTFSIRSLLLDVRRALPGSTTPWKCGCSAAGRQLGAMLAIDRSVGGRLKRPMARSGELPHEARWRGHVNPRIGFYGLLQAEEAAMGYSNDL